MKNYLQFLNEETIKIPEFLYHATYKPLLKSIMTVGLCGKKTRKNWEDSVQGTVYLADDKYVAESYAESSDLVPESYLDKIVILKIDTKGLDKTKFSIDKNNQDGDTLEFKGVISPEHITKL